MTEVSVDEEFDEETSNFVLGPINKPRWIYSCSKQLLDRVIHAYGLNNFANGSFVIYPSTYFNVGGHYSTTTGRFTAPVTGYYLFGWTSIANITGDVYRWRFGVNGATVGDLHLRQDTTATGSEYADNGTFVIPWYLTAGDYVSIYFSSDGGNLPYHLNTAAGEYPRFWGHLIG